MLNALLLKVRRGDTPFYRALKNIARAVFQANLPIPRFLLPFFGFLYRLHFAVYGLIQRLITFFYREPLFRGRCESVGKRLRLERMPEVEGHAKIYLGDDVAFTGKAGIYSGRFTDDPVLIVKDRSMIGHNTIISVNKEIVIDEDVIVGNNCVVADNDGHPRAADLRAQNAPLPERDIRPVHICRHAWIGRGAQIMKGVTIGEGAIVSAYSVVVSNIPPYCLAMGNPAEVMMRGVGKPTRASAQEA
jgi:acetyltransferase-like isoleucine patch superfamily enzyme